MHDPSMNPESKPRPLYRCCESEQGTLGDPNLGPVCADCYAWLTIVRYTLQKIGSRIGFGDCSNKATTDE